MTVVERNKSVFELYNKLSDADRTKFDDLTSFATKEQISTLANSVSDENDKSAGKTIARFDNNSMHSSSETVYFLGIEIARMNHSCKPNTTYDFWTKDGVVVAKAMQKIAKGEELTIPYCSVRWDRKARQNFLSKNYGFLCQCDGCTGPELISPKVREDLKSEEDAIKKLRDPAEAAGQNPDSEDPKAQIGHYDRFLKHSVSIKPLWPETVVKLMTYLRLLELEGQANTNHARRRCEDGARLSMIIREPDDEFTKHCKEMLKRF